MMIHEITIHTGKYKTRKRIGRGEGSGHGKTAGRGHKGAASRSGWKRRPGYEGGQMPMFRRMPKRGFTNAPFRRLFHVINVKQLDARFDDGTTVTCASLVEAGLIRDTSLPLKVLGEGTLSKKLNVTAARFSATAKTKIEEAGGTVTVDAKKKWTRAGAAFAKAALDAGKSAEAVEIAKGKKTKKAKDAPDAESAEKAAVAAEIAKGKKTKKAKDALDAEAAEIAKGKKTKKAKDTNPDA